MKRAELRLYGAVGGDPFNPDAAYFTADGVAREIEAARASGAKALDVFLSSPGGNVLEGLAVHAQLQRFPGEVVTTVDGVAASVASAIAMSGRTIMSKSSRLMIHSAWLPVPVVGNAAQLRASIPKIEKTAADLDKLSSALRDIYVSASGVAADRIQKMMDDETWMTAEEALALGFCDEIAPFKGEGPTRTARASIIDTYRNTPADLRSVGVEAALARLEGLLTRQRVTEIARSASAAASGARPGVVPTK